MLQLCVKSRANWNFNSIKVRLEPLKLICSRLIWIFQFHKGAIRTINSLVVKDYPIKFQFHKGAIRTLGSPDDLRRDVLFQFHKGAIRT